MHMNRSIGAGRSSAPGAWGLACALCAALLAAGGREAAADPLPGGSLDPTTIPKYVAPLLIPPAMPRTSVINEMGRMIDYYEIAVRQFQEQILPPGLPATTVWGYGSLTGQGTVAQGGTFNSPSFTIETESGRPVRVKWLNQLVDADNHFLPHLLPVDQTLHWANPPRDCISGEVRTDCRGQDPTPYTGPVPLVTHVHGSDAFDWSDGFTEAWYLPAASDIPPGYATTGSFHDMFKTLSPLGQSWEPGTAVFEYTNDVRAATLWYHDHALGITRLNVYAGPAGFWLVRGGPGDDVRKTSGGKAMLPGPAPKVSDGPGKVYHEIPIGIQDRSFNEDGSLFYPADRAFFEGLQPDQLQIPFIPEDTLSGAPSDVSPIWNPELFGNTMMVNGRTWPRLDVQPRRYRFRFLNGCNGRVLILQTDAGLPFWQIGADGGFLPAPVLQSQLLLGPAERADVIVDFGGLPAGTEITLLNLGPDAPFAGGAPGVDFEPADPGTTGQVMRFRVVGPPVGDPTTAPDQLVLPPLPPIGPDDGQPVLVSLNEQDSGTVLVTEDAGGNIVEVPAGTEGAFEFGPVAALLGTVGADPDTGEPTGEPLPWSAEITESVESGTVKEWQIYNFTMDAHPIHIHEVPFEVVSRTDTDTGAVRGPEPSETGLKDTVIAYPGEITRVKARFTRPGLFVWHCHLLEHEDNEMMRPYCITGPGGAQPASCAAWDARASGMP